MAIAHVKVSHMTVLNCKEGRKVQRPQNVWGAELIITFLGKKRNITDNIK